MNIRLRFVWGDLVTLMILLLLSGCFYPVIPDGLFVKYSVEGESVRVVSAVTPFDSNGKAREVYLRWFKRGVETVIMGNQPLDVEWQQSPEGQAGQQGYYIGMKEGGAFLKDSKGPAGPVKINRVAHLEF